MNLPGWIAHRCSLLRRCALRPRSFRRPPHDVDGCYEPFNLAVISGSAADSHPAYPPAMAVPETLCHPFATAKIVVMPVTWSVIAGPIIVARGGAASRNARCALAGVAASEPAIVATATKAANVFFILGPPVLDWRAFTRPAPPRYQEIPA